MASGETLLGTRCLPASSDAPISKEQRRLQRAVREDIHKLRSIDILFTVVLKGHRSDPIQALAYDTFLTMRRLLQKDDSLHDLFSEVWSLRRDSGSSPVTGPMQIMYKLAHQWGWIWASPFSFIRPVEGELQLVGRRFQILNPGVGLGRT